MQEIFQIRQNIWHIQDATDVFFTLIFGEKHALVIDSGYGKADHRSLVERLLSTPYTVINTHGHPDHTGGNSQYDAVYVHPADLEMARRNGSLDDTHPVLKPLSAEKTYDLGGIHVKTIFLPGHTKGTVGFLCEEYRLLVAGDAFNPDMWMFADNHDTLDTLAQTLQKALSLPFDSYLGSHTTREVPREFLEDALTNVLRAEVNWNSLQTILGKETYEIAYEGSHGRSSIRIEADQALKLAAEKRRGFQTTLLHGTGRPDFPAGSTLSPVFQASAFRHDTAQEMANIFAKKQAGFNYSRIGNPTIRTFEERITQLEGGAAAVAFSSGMAAITATFLNIVTAGDTILSTAGLYGGTIELFKSLSRFGIQVSYVPVNDFEALEAAITPTVKLIFAETISNPGLAVSDIEKLATLAHKYKLPLILDNTMASPYLVRPFTWGADIVIHSSSKYINGGGSGISGIVIDSGHFQWDPQRYPSLEPFLNNPAGLPPFAVRLRSDLLCNYGACLSPQNAFLNLLGLETLGLRMEKECSNTMALALYFKTLPGVTVNYPGLTENPSHETAEKILEHGFGAILTVRLGTREKAFRVMDALKIPQIVSNIGDNRTLVVHPASTMALHSTRQEQEDAGVFEDLIRISVGIEDIHDLIQDFDQAFKSLSTAST